MSVVYESAPLPRTGWDAWGTLVLGATRLPVRLLVFAGGVLIWVVAMFIVGGGKAITAIWTNALFLVPLVLVGSLVRTVGVRSIALMGFAGGALMGVMYLLAQFLGPLLGTGLRPFVMPFLEELLKILPVLGFVWLGRRTYTWAIGATDLLLLAAASGVGFGVVEDAYIRAHSGWPDQIGWLPVTEIISGRLIVGHAIWAALAGATIGLALLLRAQRSAFVMVLVGASGFAVAVLDHIANNYGGGRSDGFAGVLNFLTAKGWIALTLFFAAAITCVAVDAWIVYRRPPNDPSFPLPPRGDGSRGLAEAWQFMLDRRARAFVRFRLRRTPRRLVDQVVGVAARLEWSLYMRQPEPWRAAFAAAVAESAPSPPDRQPDGEEGAVDPPTPQVTGDK